VNDFLRYDARSRTADLEVVSGYNGANGGLNLNGGARGDQTVVVPAAWTVRLTFVNGDAEQAHSAVVGAGTAPAEPLREALPGAATARAQAGRAADDPVAIRFVAAPAGAYVIACGVPGHAAAGEWIRLRVSATAAEPTYQ
jgi:hypothetical protein